MPPLDSFTTALAQQSAALVASPLELIGFFATIANVWLLARNRVLGWPVGLIAVAVYGMFFVEIKLYADALLQGFFFVTGVLGWRDWLRGGADRTPLPVTRLSPRGWGLALAAIVACSVGVGGFFAAFTDAARPWLDSALLGASVVGQLLLMRRVLDNWTIWIVADVLYVPLYWSRTAYLTALLYAVLVVLAWRGYVDWRRVEGTARAV